MFIDEGTSTCVFNVFSPDEREVSDGTWVSDFTVDFTIGGDFASFLGMLFELYPLIYYRALIT